MAVHSASNSTKKRGIDFDLRETLCLSNSCLKDENPLHDSSQITGKIVHLSSNKQECPNLVAWQ